MSIFPTLVDVSEHQGRIDWDTVRPYVWAAIVRVQDGTYRDNWLAANVAGCERLGIPYYLYGFYQNGGRAEARLMFERAKAVGASHCLGFVCDLEEPGFAPAGVRAYVDELKALHPQGFHGLYVAHHLYNEYGADYGQGWTWVPHYGINDGTPNSPPAYPCDVWQFTSTARVPGISGNVDCNALFGSMTLEKFTKGRVDMTPEESQMLRDVHAQLMRKDDPTGRGQAATACERVPWMAAKQEQERGRLEEVAEAVEKLDRKVAELVEQLTTGPNAKKRR